MAIVSTSVWLAKAGMTVSAATAIGTTPSLTAFAAGLSEAHLKGSFGYFFGLRMPVVAKKFEVPGTRNQGQPLDKPLRKFD